MRMIDMVVFNIKLGDYKCDSVTREYINDILDSGKITEGSYVKLLEKEICNHFKVKHCVLTTSGTTALQLVSHYLGQDKMVCVPAMTFPATANAFQLTNQSIFLCDVGDDLQIDIDTLTDEQKKMIDVIVPVHLLGYSCNMDKIMSEAKKYGWFICEDTCEAVGSKVGDNFLGTIGNCGCFGPRTLITTKDGYKKINKIKVGDEVLTHKNRFRKVIQTQKHYYDDDWYSLTLSGMRYSRNWKQRYLQATKEHPILTLKNGIKQWCQIKDITTNDYVYVQKTNCDICKKPIPFCRKICNSCNVTDKQETRDKIAGGKDRKKKQNREISKFNHYYKDILPFSKNLEKEGYRVIPIGIVIPDIITIKDNKIYAYEIENCMPRKRKNKYGDFKKFYDDVVWIDNSIKIPRKVNRFDFIIDNEGDVCVKVIKNKKNKLSKRYVYNFAVEEDNSYVASQVIVHNCFSFYMSHNISAGELGCVITNDDNMASKLRILKNHGRVGSSLEFNHEYVGSNYKVTELIAALALSQLYHIDSIVKRRKENAKFYLDNINNKLVKKFEVPEGFSPLGYPLKCLNKKIRDSLCKTLNDAGIETRNIFPCLANQKAYSDFLPENYPKASELEDLCFYLPVQQYLTDEDLTRVVSVINSFGNKKSDTTWKKNL